MKPPFFKILLLFATFALCFFNHGTAAAQDLDRVDVLLVDQSGKPIIDVTITLLIYKFDERGTTVEVFRSGNCTTGQDGRCEISVSADAPKDASGFLKGALDLGERGKRSVIWPGGLLEVPIKLDEAGKVQTDTEAGPFDNDKPASLTIHQARPPLYGWGILLAVVALVVTFVLYRRAKRRP